MNADCCCGYPGELIRKLVVLPPQVHSSELLARKLSVVFDARRVDSGFQQIIHVPAIGRLVLQFGQSGEELGRIHECLRDDVAVAAGDIGHGEKALGSKFAATLAAIRSI